MKKLLCSALGMIAVSCMSADRNVVVRNQSTNHVDRFALRTSSGSFSFRYGVLPPGVMAGYSGSMRILKDDTCVATWVDTSGISHTGTVKMAEQKLPAFTDDFEFILLNGDKLMVKPWK